MGKGNRETVRERVDTVEEDLALGPIVQEVIFSHFFGADAPADSEADEVHILVSVYKYRVFVAQYDTCGQVWDLFGDAFHEIKVGISRRAVEKAFQTHDTETIVSTVRERFCGLHAVRRFASFCRSTGESFSIEESGPQRTNLVRRCRTLRDRNTPR